MKVKWDGDMRFIAENENGASLTMETGPAYGGSGNYPTPLDLLVMALGGCTGMDIVSILRKMRVDIKRFEMDIETKRRTEQPKYFEEMHIVYTVSGDGLTEDKARRAAELSTEKYCSVGAMLREKARITYDVKVD
jgi:putative redox protein